MATFNRREDRQAWQKSRQATRLVYQDTAGESFARAYGLRDQVRRASVSIMANIAAGFGRRSGKEFANFLNIAHGSVVDVQSHR